MKSFFAVLFTLTAVLLVPYLSMSQNNPSAPRQQNFPKGSLTGKITDKNGNALAGATVLLHDVNVSTVANTTGSFITAQVNAGKYLVEVTHIGFTTAIVTININGPTQKDFILTQTAVEQEEVTVTGVSSSTRLRQSPQPVTVVKKEDLMNISSTNIINALTHIPGITAVTTGPAISKPFIRGLGYNRVLTINDGVRQEGQQWGDEHGIEIDDYSVQRIEVLKGPSSLMYGSDALAGVINIQTLTPVAEGSVKGSILSEYQSNNRLRGFFGNIGGTKNGFSWNAYGTYKGAEDYKNKYDGYVFNSKFYNKDFGGMLGYSRGWGHSYVTLSSFDQHAGIVEGERDSATGRFIKATANGTDAIAVNNDFKRVKPFVPYQHIQHFKVSSDNSFTLGRSRLDMILGFQRNQRKEFGEAAAVKTPSAYFDLKTYNYALRFNLPYVSNFKTSFGLTGMYQTNKNGAAEVIIPDYNLFDAGAFVFTQYNKNKLTVSGGVRFDNRHVEGKPRTEGTDIKFSAFSRDFSNVSGSAGLSFEPTHGLTLKLNMARGFRAPNLAELGSNGAHEGTIRYEVGNNSLKSEVSTQVDGGIEVNSPHLSLSASGFYNHISNFLFYERVRNRAGGDSTRLDVATGDLLEVFNFNQHTANLYGGELNIDIHPHPLDWLHFENTFSYTRAKFTSAIDGTDNVPFIPAARFVSELRGKFLTKAKTLRNLFVSLESDYTSKQNHAFTGYNTETATPAYWLLNTSIGADIISNNKKLFSINLSALNLTDVAYQNHLSRLKYADVNNVTGRQGVFNTGRSFNVKVNVPLDFSRKK